MAMTDEPKKIVIDMAGVMEKLTPEMFDAAKDAMIEALIKGGTEWRNRADAAEAALAVYREYYRATEAYDSEKTTGNGVRVIHARAAIRALIGEEKGNG
jgi:hypothetical protein